MNPCIYLFYCHPYLAVSTLDQGHLCPNHSVGRGGLRHAMGSTAERALLAAVQHVAGSTAKWTHDPGTDREEPHAWNRITMTNRRLTCRLASHRIELWCIQVVCGPRPIFKDSAAESDEPWYDSENPPHDTSSSDSESPNWCDRKTGLHRW